MSINKRIICFIYMVLLCKNLYAVANRPLISMCYRVFCYRTMRARLPDYAWNRYRTMRQKPPSSTGLCVPSYRTMRNLANNALFSKETLVLHPYRTMRERRLYA